MCGERRCAYCGNRFNTQRKKAYKGMLIKQNYIPEPEEIIAEKPLNSALEKIKKERDAEIKDVLTGKSKKNVGRGRSLFRARARANA